MIALVIFMIILSVIIIIVSFIMSPDSNAFSGALVGSGDLDLFKTSKERGVKKILKYTMFTLGIVLLIAALVLRIFI
ncbi:preprotein translocase subunit SecG [Mycoplasmopsis alligatoris]|uniref:Protein-export membrane protein SecG n=1 Tax=Mycoplasmopsis alligatoris A21JP2 TaxID=747682 RepID=D4XWV3_9BACT|nr:preprotein translocase subunit SecG [Mycoplasmopsis alligatoris]EFF41253.1 preprotein translocase, SecG subunit [Mycoplasmopsis alligatoris A21JP2]